MGDPWGTLMTLVYVICWVLPSALIFKAKTSRLWVIAGLIISAIFALAATIGANLLVTPLYAGMTIDAVAALVVPVVPDALVALDEPAATDVRTALTALTVCAALLFLAKLNLTIQIAYSCGLF